MIPYVRIENNEAVASRRNLLSAEMNLLKVSNSMESYKKLRKQEIVKKSILKSLLRQKIAKINSLLATLPQGEAVGVKSIKQEISRKPRAISVSYEKGSKRARDIESQLQEIRDKLSKM
ncbi:MAG: hypothetical protein KKB21_03580 [Nanoarchaeota archaeon]|nr:hypothetical protein [Nanoarchaeota archaeon]MBU4086629.1 hypothetical protein [Nanoarchaeota archaeon]